MSPVRAIPTSRAYWELRAEQVLNRVFAPEAPIDVEVRQTPAAAAPAPPAGEAASRRAAPAGKPTGMPIADTWLLVGISLLVTLTTGFTLLGLTLWQQSQQAIRQERSMLLVERLRSLGPAVAPPAPELGSPGQPSPNLQGQPQASQAAGGLPPPPVEPWMEELATLPPSSAPSAQVLQVPMSRRVTSPAPAATASPTPATPAPPAPARAEPAANLPQLVGVVQVPGQPASAIFQVQGSSTSAATGESIGNSGWRLQSASGDAAVIERQGVQQRISISSGF
ncbi:MAG: hypothetical protein KFB97_16030 [Cyanobium sp. M30B3]|nr:MAG: hypothetical protein KFB97_16030 [Cyanobium sp. M30B3]